MDKSNSKLYKTTFKNGDVHYGRVASHKSWSAKNYLKDKLSAIKHNSKTPNRINMITSFELRVQKEWDRVKCEIIYEGLTLDCCKKKDELISKTPKCLNERVSTINKMDTKPRIIKKEYVKKLVSPKTNETFYYVDWVWAKSHPYFSKHIVSHQSHPIYKNFKKLSLNNIIIK